MSYTVLNMFHLHDPYLDLVWHRTFHNTTSPLRTAIASREKLSCSAPPEYFGRFFSVSDSSWTQSHLGDQAMSAGDKKYTVSQIHYISIPFHTVFVKPWSFLIQLMCRKSLKICIIALKVDTWYAEKRWGISVGRSDLQVVPTLKMPSAPFSKEGR